ncbi:MAG: cytochrome c oxidase assembly protein [Alphaproteobacteria bacterium]|nr:cytochrome c oxidase assembly protein [Alphaproteobacteria bacterium]
MTAAVLRSWISRDYLDYGGIVVAGVAIDFLCARYPAELPVWMPWEFSWPAYLTFALTLLWFGRGWFALAPERRPGRLRLAAFLMGLVSLYAVLQTHFDYFAQHMFFVHRLAHFILHHAGAFLVALGAAGPALRAGMPQSVRTLADLRIVRATVDVVQHPVVAPLLFVGLLYLWLVPQIHTRVMLDSNLYEVMNWSMALDGVLFWLLILDGRAKPPARLSFLARFLLIIAIEIPQMLLGAILSLSSTDYYPVYRICGRIMNMTALNDQHYGGLIIWLPGTLTSFAAVIVILLALKKHEEETALALPA